MGLLENDTTPTEVAKRRTPRTSAKKERAKAQVSSLINMLNHGAVALTEPKAAMRDYEREMIEEPLWTYAETHADTVGKAFDLAAPAVCITGVALWLRRVWKLSGASLPKTPPQFGKQPTPIRPPVVSPESQRVATVDQPDQPPPLPQSGGRIVSVGDIQRMTEVR